jgi:small-conductance mechanosensitive channel
MFNFSEGIKPQLINTLIVLGVFLVLRYLLRLSIYKIGRSSGINDARIRLISRYTTFALILVFLLVEALIFGTELKDLSVIFSSVFAVIGIGLFAIWSILSNITSGIIMFFSFPYKVGDKIQIYDKDFPLEAIIEDIRAFQLHLRLNNGDLVTYPNILILQKPVVLLKKDAIDDGSDAV